MKRASSNREGKRCCGRQAQLYKSKGLYYCHSCQYEYDLEGRSLGYHGSGTDEQGCVRQIHEQALKYATTAADKEYHVRWLAENRQPPTPALVTVGGVGKVREGKGSDDR